MATTMTQLDYDIIVAGGGTAGAAAAVAAARRGKRVLLVEKMNCLGGVSTAGGVGEWFASLQGLGNIFQSTIGELDRFGAHQQRFFNPEYLKIVWQGLAETAGVNLLFHASVIGVESKDGTLRTVRIACCSREILARARYFIDATGEGDLAALAGAEYLQGDPSSGLTLHITLTAWLYDTGTAAAMAVDSKTEHIRNIPIRDLRAILGADGMELDPAKHKAFAPHNTRFDKDENAANRQEPVSP
jgi:glycine/D-amino acid oxidase-like deaminating enzyme